jgi:hypothetical protein
MAIEDFRKEFNEIQSIRRPTFVRLGKTHSAYPYAQKCVLRSRRLRTFAGHHGVAILFETCSEDKLAFVERNRRIELSPDSVH